MLKCPRCDSKFYCPTDNCLVKTYPILCFWCDGVTNRTIVVYPVVKDDGEGEINVDEG